MTDWEGPSDPRKSRFTFLDLLAAVALLAVLIALLYPVLTRGGWKGLLVSGVTLTGVLAWGWHQWRMWKVSRALLHDWAARSGYVLLEARFQEFRRSGSPFRWNRTVRAVYQIAVRQPDGTARVGEVGIDVRTNEVTAWFYED